MNLQSLLGSDAPNIDITGLSENTNKIQSGFLFCAIKGTKANGIDFIPQAIQRGAVAVLTDQQTTASVPVISVPNARRTFAELSAKFYPSESLKKVAVTGTNGKTSTVYYVAQIMNALDVPTATMGTIGVSAPNFSIPGNMTTPDPVTLNKTLNELQQKKIQVVAMEASSHGLDQGRLTGNKLMAAAFTNLTRDHLDYHQTMENYFNAKARLFTDYLDEGSTAVLNADIPEYETLKKICEDKKLKIISYGKQADTLRLIQQTPTPEGQTLVIKTNNTEYTISLKIYGDFQAYNILTAVGLCMGLGKTWQEILPVLPKLTAPAGRLENVGTTKTGGQIFVDYAHTPDALERVLISLRQHTKARLCCLFGCGGNRDTGKRSQMGKIANDLADVIYITDDNPRNEDPDSIRAEIKNACPKGIEIFPRHKAIKEAIAQLQKDDILVLAGKGHESGQIIQGITYPFNDKMEAQYMLKQQNETPLWTAQELQMALSCPVDENMTAFGVNFNSKEIKPGDIFIALTNGQTDGHKYAKAAIEAGAIACIVSHPIEGIFDYQQIIVPDTLLALHALARFARMRTAATVIGITGSCGKTTTKEMLKTCLMSQGKTYATPNNFNSNLGVPFTLANMPADTQYAIIEMGVSHPGEMTELSDFVRPNISLITNIAPAHQEYFADTTAIATEKSHIMDYQDKTGTFILNADDPLSQFMADKATAAGIKKIIRFGENERADFRADNIIVTPPTTQVHATWHGESIHFTINCVGKHFALNALSVLATVDAAGASTEQAIIQLPQLHAVQGRGATVDITLNGKHLHIINDAYNANPASMKAALQALGTRDGRKIAVLGDMLELGEKSRELHLDILNELEQNSVSKLYAVGEMMGQVFDLTPPKMQGAKVDTATALAPILTQELQDGDWVLFKASNSMNLEELIQKVIGE